MNFIDCTYYLPNETTINSNLTIFDNDLFFDLDVIADSCTNFKHMFPKKEIFDAYCTNNNLNKNSLLVFYDHKGIFSAPRVFFTFLAHGYRNIGLLNGGSPIATSHNKENLDSHIIWLKDIINLTEYTHIDFSFFTDSNMILTAQSDVNHYKIIDARPSDRFNGLAPEPREGLKSGHMRHAVNIPFGSLLTDKKQFKPKNELKQIFDSHDIKPHQTLVFSCGSGITACVVAFASLIIGHDPLKIKIYDASWSEWGQGAFEVV